MRFVFMTLVLLAFYAAFASTAVPVPEVHETTEKEWLRNGPKLVTEGVKLVKLTDKTPLTLGGPPCWAAHPTDDIEFADHHLHMVLFTRLEGFENYKPKVGPFNLAYKFYADEKKAHQALSDAAMKFAREAKKP